MTYAPQPPGPRHRALVFETLVLLLEAARRAVAENSPPAGGRDSAGEFAAYEDVDGDACMERLDAICPGSAVRAKRQILDWSIIYYYSK